MGARERQPFADLFELPLRNGLTRPKAVRGEGTKMINMGEVFAHRRIRNLEMDRVPLDDTERKINLLRAGDLLFARQSLVLSGAGKCCLFQGDEEDVTFESHIIRCRLNERVADPAFYFYLFQSQGGRSLIESIVEQVAAAGIRGSDLGRLNVPVPPLAEQQSIAAILGTLDDKIELNLRMNTTLETMARALFQSWFVDFDPVRAKLDGGTPKGMDEATASLFPSAFEQSTWGPIPKGWRRANLGEVVEIFDSKRIPLSGRQRAQRKGRYPYYGAASVMDYVDDFIFDGIYLLMGEDGSVINDDGSPVIQYVWGKFWVNNHAHVIRGTNGVGTEHLLLHLKNSNIAAFVTGAVQPKLNQGNMNRIDFVLPPKQIGEAFAEVIEPVFAQIRANVEQSRTLGMLRDTLLPKLLNGEVKVGTAAEVA